MKKIFKLLVFLGISYGGIYFALSSTEAGVLVLQAAAQQNNKFLTSLFVSLGADVNAKNAERLTPLHVAAFLNSDRAIEELIAKGGDVNAADNESRTPLHLAAYSGNAQAVKTLVQKGANIEAVEKINAMTALHLAVVKGSMEVVTILVEKEADINAYANNDVTPLLIANGEGKHAIADFLIDNGAQ